MRIDDASLDPVRDQGDAVVRATGRTRDVVGFARSGDSCRHDQTLADGQRCSPGMDLTPYCSGVGAT